MIKRLTPDKISAVRGRIFDVQRFCTHDGPGIRTVVFLKGCPLSCLWCHNPEGKCAQPQLAIYFGTCIACGRCAAACQSGAVQSRDLCTSCGACADACPSEARRLIGRETSSADLVETAMRDEPFFQNSGGGVTLSGGEPLAQPAFALAVLRGLKDRGAHTAVETSGYAPWDVVEQIAPYVDIFLHDIKVIDAERHRKLCGVDNVLILANARRLSESGAQIFFRTPIIPGLNDTPTDLAQLGEFILSLPNQHTLELMPYHRIGSGKYEALGLDSPLPGVDDAADLTDHKQALRQMGVELAAE